MVMFSMVNSIFTSFRALPVNRQAFIYLQNDLAIITASDTILYRGLDYIKQSIIYHEYFFMYVYIMYYLFMYNITVL